ncbi:MAG: sulfatase [Planctomycetes bacterium]|nr:sulfatase [Planctomycetota bacterium]
MNRGTRLLLLASAPALALAAAPGCTRAPAGRLPVGNGVLVIAVDALRADHMHAYGYDRETTPRIDSWATQGCTFLQTFSPSPEMQGAHTALLTGTEPALAHRNLAPTDDPVARLAEWSLPQGLPRLAREFLAAGYTTAAFVDHFGLSNVYGYASGFEDFQCFAPDSSESSVGYEAVSAKLFAWLRERSMTEDWFAYVHVNDLERVWENGSSEERFDTFFAPRAELDSVPPVAQAERSFFAIPRPRWRNATRTIGEYEALYDGALRSLDEKFGKLFDELRNRGRLRNTTVVIVGTYGMGFGEAGLVLDSGTLADCDLHVPMIVRPAPILNCRKNVRSSDLASLCDLAPTLLDLAKLPVPRGMTGFSLVPELFGSGTSPRELCYARGGVHGGFSVFDSRWCFESIDPAAGGSPELVRSWTGEDRKALPRQHLHDRTLPGDLGHLGESAHDDARAAGMELAGREWYEDVDLAGRVLRGSLSVSDLQPALRKRLVESGLLAEKP